MLGIYGILYLLIAVGLFVALRNRERLRAAAYTSEDSFDKPCFSMSYLLNADSGSRFHLPFALVSFIMMVAILLSAVSALFALFYVGVGASIVAVGGIILILPALYSFEALLYFLAATKAVKSLGHRDVRYVEYFTRWLWAGLGWYAFVGIGMFVLREFLPTARVVFFITLAQYVRLIFWSGLTLFSGGAGFALSLFAVAGTIIAGWVIVKLSLGLAGRFVGRVLKLRLETTED
jgi:hypothetical protein